MPPDLRGLLERAAPQPAGDLDQRAIARRARRIGWTRVVAAVAVATTVAGGGVVATTSLVRDETQTSREDPARHRRRPTPAPRHELRRMPPGPRHEVVSGVHGNDWSGARAGAEWRLLVWGGNGQRCFQHAYDDTARNESASCTHDLTPARVQATVFGASLSFFTESSDPDEYYFVLGEVGPRVEHVEFRPEEGGVVEIPLHAPPDDVDVPFRYYAVTLPRFDYADFVALDGQGEVLSARDLCGAGCQADRERERDDAVAAYEAAPVTLDAGAGAFAVEAAARAGMVDQLATFWTYRGISRRGDEFVASFRTTDCSGPVGVHGRICRGRYRPGTIVVGISDGRFVVAGAQGEMTAEQRAALESYSAEVTDDGREWRLVSYSFERAGRRKWDVAFVWVWTGNMGAPRDYGSLCALTFFGTNGRVIDEGRAFPFEIRNGEESRVMAGMTSVSTPEAPRHVLGECDPPMADVSHQDR